MCFCFDGANAVAAYRPENCRERLADASALAPGADHPSGGRSRPAAAVSFKPSKQDRLTKSMRGKRTKPCDGLAAAVDRCGQAKLPGLQLQRQILRIVARLMEVAAMEPQRLLLGRLPHVALLAFPGTGVVVSPA
ncbi:hypothetical protein C7I87_00070 [Mesorhizobium sp. SARCC-RB16n]|nr:hypothetical protein C7I87_00070 [Mesorhizobium sp. SARCC-RB16n]